ncbi:efflux RND transporter permease subunit [Syntrophus sp. (in: bacteria)]|uniref:efflux RND transporter permease subunit n=1 Tax=Syntrophus sp. (in: bacteria) TaxID=48412 RepID=UPI00345EA43D
MNLSEPFIRRPVMTMLCMLSIVLAGLIGYRLLPVSDLPAVDFPTISVSASLPGANPETMASTVATPLEKEFTTIAGLDSMISTSSQGSTRITLQFDLNRNIDAAAQDVQSAISRASRRLPEDLPTPPSFRKVNPADQPILYLALTSPTLPMYLLNEYGETQLAQQISRVTGVAQVSVYGSQKYAVRIELDPHALASRGIGIDEVSSVIGHYNVNNPLGTLTGAQTLATLQSENQLMKAGLYLPLVVAYRDGQPVRLQELGNVRDSVENDRVAAWFATPTTRSRAIILAIQRQPGTNTIQVADAIKALLPAFREKLPASVSLVVLRDSSIPIKDSARDVQFTLYLTLVLVVLVIFLFLRNLSATVIPSLTLPVSLIGTFAVMYLLDYSIDNLSLMALTLSVGFVVDDAIVMLENIMRHIEMGKPRMQAALEGAREIGFTIVSMTLSLAAVFIPVLFMGGIVGRLFREFSVTIAVAVLISGFVSLSLTPMLASRFIRAPGRERHGRVYLMVESGFDAMLSFYRSTLLWVLSRERATLIFSAALLAATVFLFYAIPKGFIPSEDRDQISIRTEAAENISFDSMVQHQLALLDIVQKDPNVDRFMCSVASGGGQSATNTGSMFIVLKPRRERELSADQVIDRLRPKLASVPGIRAFPTNPPPINIGGRVTKSLYQVTFQGIETKELFRYGAEMEDRMRRMEELQDVSSDLQLKNPEVHIDIDRDQAFILNVTPMQIENALYSAYGSRQISTIYTPNNDYQVIMELLPQYRTDPSVLSMLHVRSSTGQLVPLRAITTLREDIGPLTISHSGQLPSVTISFNLKPGYSLGQAVERIQAMTAASMPSGMTFEFQGTAKAFQSSLARMGILLILAIVVIYIILGILYESFYHPVTILSALPFAGFGALLALMAFRHDLSIYAFVGIVMLVGLVKKNGIMMVDFAIEAQRRQGKNPHDAVYEACLVRFRPIMMTTMAALMAGLPIALGYGAGAESRRPLGLAVVGGLLFSQTLTLYVTPVFYVAMEKLRSRIASGHRKQDSATGAEP